MNPWGDVPKPRKYPLGEIQRILGESPAYNNYQKTVAVAQQEGLESSNEGETPKLDIVTEAYELLKMNLGISELKSDFEAIGLYSRYNRFVSETALQEKIKITSNLLNVIRAAMEINIGESSFQRDPMASAGNNFITIDYQDKAALIETLKFVKKNESKIDQGSPLCIREDMEIQDLVTYFFTKEKKLDGLLDTLSTIHNKLVLQHEQIEKLQKR
jgi:hypothetical protein